MMQAYNTNETPSYISTWKYQVQTVDAKFSFHFTFTFNIKYLQCRQLQIGSYVHELTTYKQ